MITVTIKCSTGSNFSISVEPSNTIGEFKQLLVEKSSIPKEQQRLIYSGHVLKDQQTVESYSIKDGHTVHLVRGASNNTAAQARTVPVNTTTPSPSLNSPLIPPNIGGFGGFGLGNQNLQQMQQQLMQNPETMRELLNSPIMQSLMSNPELMRSMLMNDPQMREVIERNPEVGHILNDPQILRQSMELARNPELMREMMRNTDRAMSNIESHPEGFNLLRRMYTNVQEPLQNATQLGQNSNPTIGNPVNQSQTSSPQPSAPNTNPLPNPWGTPSVNPTMFKLALALCGLACVLATPIPEDPLAELGWRIVGGESAADGQFPYQISMRNGGSHSCGGSILDETTILCAAHCVDGVSAAQLTVVAGTNTLNAGGDSHKVSSISMHKDYDSWNIQNDISILKLATPLDLSNPKIGVVGLPSSNIGGGENVILSGWGRTSYPGNIPNDLQWINLRTITVDECKSLQTGSEIIDSEVCTLTQSGEGACHGDSGGPLVDTNGNQIGIVSWGTPCARGYPDVFTRVYSFLDWIKANRG